jgi:hypothetical protein
MRIPYGRVQGSGYKACTGKYCIICPGGTKKKKRFISLDLKHACALILMKKLEKKFLGL